MYNTLSDFDTVSVPPAALSCGLGGGVAFEFFFFLCGSSSDQLALQASLRELGRGYCPTYVASVRAHNALVDDLRTRYYGVYMGFLGFAGHLISQKTNSALLTMTQVAMKCGLSNAGVSLLASLGWLMPRSTWRGKKVVLLGEYEQHVLTVLRGPHPAAVWVDNFTRFFYSAVVRQDVDISRTTDGVTACCLIPSRASTAPQGFRFVQTITGPKCLPCVDANSMFTATVMADAVRDLTKRGKPVFNSDYYRAFYNNSFCKRLKLANNPLKPPLNVGEVERPSAVPVGMLPMGTSSTLELTKTFDYLQTHFATEVWGPSSRYSFLVVDVAIYLALMRRHLGTERDGALKEMAVKCFPMNGHWHVCKAVLLKLYDWCFPWLIVPFRRRVNPGQTIYKVKVRVGTVVRTFNMIALAYEKDRKSWHRYYDSKAQPAVALEQFFEFLVPFVPPPRQPPPLVYGGNGNPKG